MRNKVLRIKNNAELKIRVEQLKLQLLLIASKRRGVSQGQLAIGI